MKRILSNRKVGEDKGVTLTPHRPLFAIFAVALFLTACLLDPGARKPKSTPGFANLTLTLEKNRPTLAKQSASDTTFSLDSLIIVLSASGEATQTHRYSLTGRPDTGSIAIAPVSFTLPSLRNWKATFYTIDTTVSPSKRDTVHIDSVVFAVLPADTAMVTKTISAAYSVLRARFLSFLADSLGAGIRYVRLRVNGVTRDSLALSGGVNHAIFYPTNTTGWLAGDSGRVYKSTDSGNSWFVQNSGVSVSLRGLWFNSTTEGWAVGQNGTIVKSNGSTWSSQTSGVTRTLNGAMFVNASKGYVVGDSGLILKTLNGGTNWFRVSGGWFQQSAALTNNINGVEFIDANTGWAVADSGKIFKTTTSGNNWVEQTNDKKKPLQSVFATSTSIAIAVGDSGIIKRTTNGGTNWSNVTSGTTSNLRSISVNSAATRFFVAGASGTIRRSTNGTSWTAQTSGTTNTLNAIYTNGSRVWAVGDGGVIRRRTDLNSGSYSTVTSGTTTDLNGVYFTSSNHGYVVGDGGLIRKCTNPNNDNWTTKTSGTTENLMKVFFSPSDTSRGWVVGENGTILYTTNGGTNWAVQNSETGQDLLGINAVSSDSVFVVGAAGTILKTRNAGVTLAGADDLNGVYFKGDTGYVVGEAGVSLRTTNAGLTWSALTGGGSDLLRSVFISPSGNNVYAVGDAGRYLTTSNATHTSVWTVRSSGTSQNLRSVWVSTGRIYAVGDSGVIRSATSLADLTVGLTSGTTQSLRSVACQPSTDYCWATGTDETVVRTPNTPTSTWTFQTSGAKLFDELLTFKYLKPGVSNTILIQAVDRASPLRGYQTSFSLTVGAGKDSTINYGLTRCGYGGLTPSCTP